jgi:Sap, sulfolipid-1-addressing protein
LVIVSVGDSAGVDVAFALTKFVVIEVPIASYTVDPDGTAARVGRFSRWMHANKLAGVDAVVGLVGIVLIAEGISRLG